MAKVRQLFQPKSFKEVQLISDACEELNKFSASHPKQTHSCLHSACGYYLIECAL